MAWWFSIVNGTPEHPVPLGSCEEVVAAFARALPGVSLERRPVPTAEELSRTPAYLHETLLLRLREAQFQQGDLRFRFYTDDEPVLNDVRGWVEGTGNPASVLAALALERGWTVLDAVDKSIVDLRSGNSPEGWDRYCRRLEEEEQRRNRPVFSTLPRLLRPLVDDDELLELFWAWCEFAPVDEPPLDWVKLESKESLQVVGKDGCGGRYCLFPATDDYAGRLLYVDSEGSAGVIADSLTEGIRMMLALPTWCECLWYSGGGQLEEMRKAEALSLRHFRARHPDVDETRLKLSKALGVSPMPAAIETLHRVATEGAAVKVLATDYDHVYEGLIRNYVADDCQYWKKPD